MKDMTRQNSIHRSGPDRALGPPVQAAAIHRTVMATPERTETGVEAAFPFAALAPLIPTAVNAISKLF